MKALIVDDESKARNLLRTILEESCPEIVEIFEAKDLPSGVSSIHKNQPDVVFLDVEMPGYAGTQILDFFDDLPTNFQIVFTTAYSEYAIKAFEVNAISYLLKPIRTGAVKDAVKRVSEIISSKQIHEQLKGLSNSLKTKSFGKIGLPVSDGVLFLKTEEIYYFRAEGMYTEVVTVNDGTQLISKPLKYFVELLSEKPEFFRTHRSFFINIAHIKQLVKRDGNYILMDNDDSVTASREKMDLLIDKLEGV